LPRHLIVAAISVVACVATVGVVGCSGAERAATRDQATLAGNTVSLVRAANKALHESHNKGRPMDVAYAHLVSDPPVLGRSTAGSTNKEIAVSAGSYLLAAVCAGSGHVRVTFAIGRLSSTTIVACKMPATAIRIRLNAHHVGDRVVQVTARQRQPVAVAYKLISLSGHW